MTVDEQLRDLQRRVKLLATNRDTIIRDAGVQEQKLLEAYQKLRDLGIDSPENLSEVELQALAQKLQAELTTAIVELTNTVEEGERLLAK